MSVERVLWLPVFTAVAWVASSPTPAADPFAVGMLSCAAETDRDRRLDCYDRAIVNYTAGLSDGRRGPIAGGAQAPVGPTGKSTPSPARHLSARIASIEHFPDYVVVHLDNQQVWKQVSDSSGSLMLRDGDSVTIDRQMGSYWLAGPKGEAVQVKPEAASTP